MFSGTRGRDAIRAAGVNAARRLRPARRATPDQPAGVHPGGLAANRYVRAAKPPRPRGSMPGTGKEQRIPRASRARASPKSCSKELRKKTASAGKKAGTVAIANLCF